MSQKILSCAILKHELECIIKGKGIEVDYLDAGLHVEPDKLAEAMTAALDNLGEPEPTVVIGTLCHPEIYVISYIGNNVKHHP